MKRTHPRRPFLTFAIALAVAMGPGTSAQSPPLSDALAPLTATDHPLIPPDPLELWLAPQGEPRRVAPAAARFSAGVRLHAEEKYREALPLISALPRSSLLADYAEYYKLVALARLSRLDDADATLRALTARPLEGHLRHSVRLAAAEVAEARGDHAKAADVYRGLLDDRPLNPAGILMRLARALEASGDTKGAAAAWSRVYYEHPLSDEAPLAKQELDRTSSWGELAAGSPRYRAELARAERLFSARRYSDAREGFARVQPYAEGDDRELVAVRLGATYYHLQRYVAARATLEPYLSDAKRRAEALFYYLSATREVGYKAEFVRLTRELVAAFPNDPWAEAALNGLATHFIKEDEDARANGVFLEMLERFPDGRYAPRAAWKAGWWAYKEGRYDDAVRIFEQAAARFPRNDYRPSWLYWAARSHDRAGRRDTAHARFALVVTDYANSYYGRLASKILMERRVPLPPVPARFATTPPPADLPPLPPTEGVIRALIAHELYADALNELQYAQQTWGDSAAIQATLGFVYSRLGELRRGINAIKRAYPQYLAAGGEELPVEMQKVLFPIAHWDLIEKHCRARGLDPYLIAALINQESTFDPAIRSSANAVGLMQILPSTGRRYARRAGIARFRPSMLTNPEINVRLGTTIFVDKLKQFDGDLVLTLASYNAGPSAVKRWIEERRGMNLERDEFIDDIPYPETQGYVKKILGTADDYRRLYGAAPRPKRGSASATARTADQG
ncbi:MAG TPA: transglycosylase SLT domain-containing protein [Vicinamibacterales bacterium]|nr:transglycosylase SLT domain-containing protein [Vicinamibacterales bacterium]